MQFYLLDIFCFIQHICHFPSLAENNGSNNVRKEKVSAAPDGDYLQRMTNRIDNTLLAPHLSHLVSLHPAPRYKFNLSPFILLFGFRFISLDCFIQIPK